MTFQVVCIEQCVAGDVIGFSTDQVTVLRSLKFEHIVYVELSNGRRHSYKCGCLVRKYHG